MKDGHYNIIVLDISCFNGMASSKRIRNLLEPLITQDLIKVNNLIFQGTNGISRKGNIDRINYEIITYKTYNIFTILNFFFRGIAFIKKNKLQNHTNILYNYGGPNIKDILFIFFAKIIGYKIICDIVEDNRYESITGFMNGFKTKSSLILLRFSRYFANCLIGISDHLVTRLNSIAKEKIPVFLVPISVNLKYFEKTNYSTKFDDLKIFYGGSFNEKDGLEYLIPAFDQISEKYKNTELIITGQAVPTDAKRFQEILNKTVNKNKIIFKGFLGTDEYYKLLNSCDIFCMTRVDSKYANAGFPFKLGEFLASGKTVIATCIGDVPKYLSDKINAIVINPNSTDQIVEALSFLIENPDKIRSIGIEGRKTAEHFFDSEKVSMNLYSILQSI